MSGSDPVASAPLHVVVVGSGPAGFYAAQALLAGTDPTVRVDVIERLATPWGLVRSGVAPDHPKIKSVADTFVEIAGHERFRWYGNLDLGADVTRDELLTAYDAVIYAVGSQTDRRLGVPGEDLPGSIAATDLVGWYNGHPHYQDVVPALHHSRAVVVGNGNVALDVARILCSELDDLRRTDIADHALDALAGSAVREVVVLGRRGPVQATWTTLELRELGHFIDADVVVEPAGVLDVGDDGLPPVVRRNLAALRTLVERPVRSGVRRLVFRFLRSPVALHGADRVERVEIACNKLAADDTGRLRARDTGGREELAAGLVVRSVGYLGVPVDDLPFDPVAGHISHDQGRVVGHDREYVVGWIKRGPTGVIGTNKKDARETVERLLADLAQEGPRARAADRPERLEAWLLAHQPELVTAAGWRAIDRVERQAGELQGRPRIKLVRTKDLLAAARQHLSGSSGSSTR